VDLASDPVGEDVGGDARGERRGRRGAREVGVEIREGARAVVSVIESAARRRRPSAASLKAPGKTSSGSLPTGAYSGATKSDGSAG
jgi:hypothetical protein